MLCKSQLNHYAFSHGGLIVLKAALLSKKLLFIINVDWFFLSHFAPVAIKAKRCGYEVHVATTITNRYDILANLGFVVHPLKIQRGGLSIASDLKLCWNILFLLRKVKPDILHLFTIKPVLFGGILGRLLKIPMMVSYITGLGFLFTSNKQMASVVRVLAKFLYRFALAAQHQRVVCENYDDSKIVARVAMLSSNNISIISGAGIDLSICPVRTIPQGTPAVVMAARLLRDKGVFEFVAAARLLKQLGITVEFYLAGEPDHGNPSTITIEQLSTWEDEGIVQLLGYCSDIPDLFSKASIVVLPSYREGLPKVLIEAAACGRAVVTTDVPGCRDAIEPDKSGLLVPVKNPVALADAIQRLIDDPELCRRMGKAGRDLAERKFAIEKIVDAHLKIYKELEEKA